MDIPVWCAEEGKIVGNLSLDVKDRAVHLDRAVLLRSYVPVSEEYCLVSSRLMYGHPLKCPRCGYLLSLDGEIKTDEADKNLAADHSQIFVGRTRIKAVEQ